MSGSGRDGLLVCASTNGRRSSMRVVVVRNPPAETDSASDDLTTHLRKARGMPKDLLTIRRTMPMNQTQRDIREVPFCVLRSHMLCFCPAGVAMSSFTTILNLLQKSSPLAPRGRRTVSSVSPRMIGLVANLTSREVAVEGRAKTGAIGTIGGCRGCGVLGTPPPWLTMPSPNWDISGDESVRPSGVATGLGRARFRAATGAAYPGRGAARGMG